MSKKINSYIVLDFETGGLFGPSINPAVEFGCIGILGTTYEQVIAYDNIIKPYDDKLIYDPGASAIHGLDKTKCAKDGVNLSQVCADIEQICIEVNVENSKIARPIIVGHNATFDIAFLCDIMGRAKKDLSKLISGYTDHKGNFQPHYIDTLQLCKNVEGVSLDKSIKFNLGECCRRFGIEVIDGHRAMNDVIPTKELFVALMTRLRSSGGSGQSVGVDSFREKFQI